MQPRGFGAAIPNRDPDQYIIWRILSILSKHIEVSIVIEGSSVGEFKFGRLQTASPVLLD